MTSTSERKWRWLPGLVLMLAAGGALAADSTFEPAPWAGRVQQADTLPALQLPQLDGGALAREDRRRAEAGEPFRFAEPRQVMVTPDRQGSWVTLPGGDRLWRWRVTCPEALSLNLGFSRFDLPVGASLRIAPAAGDGRALVFTRADVRNHGQLWTPVLVADDLLVEMFLPAARADRWELELTTIGCGYRLFGEQQPAKSGDCNVDVVCPEGDGWREQIASVGVYTVNGYWTCTGSMVNNTAQDERPLFLTAHHCGVGPTAAASVVVYWNYESPACGQHGGGSLDQFTSGSTLLASYDASDFTLLELAESPDPVFGVNFAGWDRSPDVPPSAVAVHHPSTDEKSISFENDPLSITSYTGTESPGNGTHLRVADWDLGTTEVGSSGSPLFNDQKRIVGQLHGGYAACDNDLPDWYGRFHTSWTGGNSSATRLSDWLDPRGLECVTLDLLNPVTGSEDPLDPENCPGTPVDPPSGFRISAMAPNPFQDFVEITVELESDAWTTAKVFDVQGKLVADLGGEPLTAGENVVAWGGSDQDGRRLPAGVYVLVMEAGGKQASRRFVRLN
jgi:lysyl endopeptidase